MESGGGVKPNSSTQRVRKLTFPGRGVARDMKTSLAFVSAVLVSWSALSQVLYDINFQTADQAVNSVVRTGPAPSYVSAVWFGTPTVVAGFGGLTSQPLRFDSIGLGP